MDLDEGPDGLEEESFETEEKKTMSTRSRTHSRSRSRLVALVSKEQFFPNVAGILSSLQVSDALNFESETLGRIYKM